MPFFVVFQIYTISTTPQVNGGGCLYIQNPLGSMGVELPESIPPKPASFPPPFIFYIFIFPHKVEDAQVAGLMHSINITCLCHE